jgi:hypothetical protein
MLDVRLARRSQQLKRRLRKECANDDSCCVVGEGHVERGDRW